MKLVTWKSWVVKNQQSRSVPHSKWPLLILFYALGGGAVLWSDGRELSDKEKSLRDSASAAGTSNMEAKCEISRVTVP